MRYHALAADYDGTLAHHGIIEDDTWAALRVLKESGRKLVMVTGRELDELLALLPTPELFDRIVAENGALVYEPATKEVRPIAPAPPPAFAEELVKRGVERVAVGRVIVATWEPHQDTCLAVIRDLGLEMQVIFNKGAVMILPSGVNKAAGLRAALKELSLSPHNVVGVGDAENDHALLAACACGVAVANALPSLKEAADWTTTGDHGRGVAEIIQRLVEDDLNGASKRNCVLLGEDVELDPQQARMIVCGTSGSGKSTLTQGLLERLKLAGYQFAIIDPEGDYAETDLALSLGTQQRAPGVEEVLKVLEDPDKSIAVNFLGVALEHRPEQASSLLAALADLRARTGRPHAIVVDEAHHMLPADWAPAAQVPLPSGGMLYITVHPESVAPRVLKTIDRMVALGDRPDRTIDAFAKAIGRKAPPNIQSERLEPGHAIYWPISQPPRDLAFEPPKSERKRHSRKYAEGNLGKGRAFVFRGPDGKLSLSAHNLMLFLLMSDGVDDATWQFHLEAGDYAKWFKVELKDEELAAAATEIEGEGLPPRESRAKIREAIEARYTLPADVPSGIVD